MYDIIGDIHGYATKLKSLLRKLGYTQDLVGNWHHISRKAVFVGDIINKGPEIKEAIAIVRGMVESGYAKAILGNHELLLLGNNRRSYYSTLEAYENDPEQLKSDRDWISKLPLFLDLDGCVVVHAYWDQSAIYKILTELPGAVLSNDYLAGKNIDQSLKDAIRLICNGPYYYPDREEEVSQKSISVQALRLRWWQQNVNLYEAHLPPLFFGHYCLSSEVALIAENICCLDFCVYGTERLVAYQWDGEQHLSKDKFVVS